MPHIRLIHWNEEEARERAILLQDAGYEVVNQPITSTELRSMRESPPEAVIIDLSRLPSQGRDIGVNIRTYKSTRYIPLIFVGGKRGKVERVRKLLPDATYTSWDNILEDLERATSIPIQNPIIPESLMAGYSGAPLVKKLGINATSTVALVKAPEGFDITLSDLPDGAVISHDISDGCDLILWFVRSQTELQNGIEAMGKYAGGGGLWILWPKKASGVASDLTQNIVRETGLANDLVDFKICSVDKTWSALRFTQRKKVNE
jgi:hypothetical protein